MTRALAAAVLGLLLSSTALAEGFDKLEGYAAPAAGSPEETEAKARAKEILDEGNRAFEAQKPGVALAKFESAYRVFPSPKILFNLAEAHRTLGHDEAALYFYERFLADAEPQPGSKIAEAAKARIEGLRPKVAKAPPPKEEREPKVERAPVAAAESEPVRPKSIEPEPVQAEATPEVPEARLEAPAEPAPEVSRAIVSPAPPADDGVTGQWWFWGAIGAVVIVGAAVAIAASSSSEPVLRSPGELATTSTADWMTLP